MCLTFIVLGIHNQSHRVTGAHFHVQISPVDNYLFVYLFVFHLLIAKKLTALHHKQWED